MSYPSKIHALIVEDESSVRETYSMDFTTLAKKYPLSPPIFALSYEDALSQLNSHAVFHLVIVDLGLPFKTRQEANAGIEPGINIVRDAAKRENYPIPALLVISGRLGLSKQSELGDKIKEDFAYGRLVVKGPEQGSEIEKAIQAVMAYNSIGIHIQDCGDRWYPTIAPREVDLLRRCVLKVEGLGVDIRWWGAERGKSDVTEDENNGATKVLVGRFLLDQGQGHSRPSFFKFEPSANGPFVFKNAKIMEQKLQHIKVCYQHRALRRSLLVTQCVSNGDPLADING